MIWEELKDSCLVVLRPKACAEDREKEKEKGGKGGKWEWREEKTEEEDQLSVAKKAKEVEKPELHRGVDWDSLQLRRHPRRLVGPTGSLRSPTQALTRTSVPLTLASFTILSAGATGRNFFCWVVYLQKKHYTGSFLAANKVSSFSLPNLDLVATKTDPW